MSESGSSQIVKYCDGLHSYDEICCALGMICSVMTCNVMICYVMTCYVMICYVIICYDVKCF